MVLSTDTASQLDVFMHYGYMLSMCGTQVGIFQEAGQVLFSSLQQYLGCTHLEAQIELPVSLCYLTNQVCKAPFTNEVLGALLVLAYHVESHCPQVVPLVPLQSPFKTLCGGPSPTVDLTQLVSVLVFEGPTPATIFANIWVMEDPSNLHAASNPPAASSSSSFLTLQVRRCTSRGCPQWGTPPSAHLSVTFILTT